MKRYRDITKPENWWRNFSTDLKSRPRQKVFPPLSLSKLMKNRRASRRNMGARG